MPCLSLTVDELEVIYNACEHYMLQVEPCPVLEVLLNRMDQEFIGLRMGG